VNKTSVKMSLPEDAPEPRLCHLIKWPDFDGYGFNLHAEKAKSGQFIGKVDDESPAQTAGLRENDRIIEVNGVNIANENHRQVVERIKSVPNETKLLVVDEAADKWYKERKLVVKSNFPNVIHMKTPVPRPSVQTTTNSNPMMKVNGEKETNGNNVTNVTVDVAANNNKNTSTTNGINGQTVNGSSSQQQQQRQERQESPVRENGANFSGNSTPQSIPKSQSNGNDETQNNGRPSSGGSNANTASIPGSPTSTKSSASSGPVLSSDGGGLNLNMSASEMRQILAQRKKHDPKKAQMDLRQKYDMIQQM